MDIFSAIAVVVPLMLLVAFGVDPSTDHLHRQPGTRLPDPPVANPSSPPTGSRSRSSR
jgi:hypothetical protein